MKNEDSPTRASYTKKEATPSVAKLTEANLRQVEDVSVKAAPKEASKKGKKGSAKPAWAVTQKQQETDQEEEIDNLLEFAYELDYEQYMDDLEVRQALAVIKERVAEMKKDQDWKEKIADEWNQANKQEGPVDEQQSVASYCKDLHSLETGRSGASKYSVNTLVREERRRAKEQKDWDASVTSEMRKTTVEDKVAARIAMEVLKDNKKLGGIHSAQSIQKLLQKEAKKLLDADGGVYNPPIIAVTKDRERADLNRDVSNLPYLHKHPAV